MRLLVSHQLTLQEYMRVSGLNHYLIILCKLCSAVYDYDYD